MPRTRLLSRLFGACGAQEAAIIKRKPVLELKTPDELKKMRKAGKAVAVALKELESAARPGVTTAELDRIAAGTLEKHGAVSAFLGYCGYPAVLCVSINNEVVHGIPDKKRRLRDGDIVSFDIGSIVDGYCGDAAVTVPVGEISGQAKELLLVTRQALDAGIKAARPGGFLGDISHAVQSLVEARGMSVVRDFVGHGIGRHLHEEPPVPNYGRAGTGVRLSPGLTLAIEPMVNRGGYEVQVLDNGWTVETADGSLSAHFEHTVAVTENGCEVLTLP